MGPHANRILVGITLTTVPGPLRFTIWELSGALSTTPNVMRTNRPGWLAPFNFFLFPLISDLGGYPAGFDRSNFKFIIPFESDRSRWKSLRGINLWDEKIYRISMHLGIKRTAVVPESFRIILRQYLRHAEAKSLAPDGSACAGDTIGLLRRASIVAG